MDARVHPMSQTAQDPSVPELRRATVADRAHDLLREWLVSGRLTPGERLSERDLAEALQVSRTPLRTALARLENDVLLRRTRSGGLEVVTLSERDLGNLYACRCALDVLAARLAAESATPEDITAMERALEDAERGYVRSDPERTAAANRAFHRLIGTASRNDWPERILRPQEAHFERIGYALVRDLSRGPAFLAEHRTILDAIAARDPEQAERAVREHIASIISRVLSSREEILGRRG